MGRMGVKSDARYGILIVKRPGQHSHSELDMNAHPKHQPGKTMKTPFYSTRIVLVAAALLTTVHAHAADSTDWASQFAGLDGISVSCVRTIEKKYTTSVCDQLKSHAVKALEKAGIAVEDSGTVFSRSQDGVLVPPSGFKQPLNLIINVRATEPGPLGMDVQVNASITYAEAIEKDGTNVTARKGELLLWRTGATASGSGGSKRFINVITGAMTKRMDVILKLLDEHWTR